MTIAEIWERHSEAISYVRFDTVVIVTSSIRGKISFFFRIRIIKPFEYCQPKLMRSQYTTKYIKNISLQRTEFNRVLN